MACDGLQRPPGLVLEATTTIGPAASAAVASLSRLDLRGCILAATDPRNAVVHILPDSGLTIRQVGRRGSGPGELQFPRAVAITPDSGLAVLDWGRRRFIKYSLGGTLVVDRPLEGGVNQHSLIGKLLSLPDGRFADYWLADPVSGVFVPDNVFDTVPLISLLDESGHTLPGGWGKPIAPPSAHAFTLRTLLQAGDLVVYNDTVIVLRNATGALEWYPVGRVSTVPARSLALPLYRRLPRPAEEGVRISANGLLEGGTRLDYDYATQAFTVDGAGRLYVITRLNTAAPALPWPDEALVIYDREGQRLAAYKLETRNTRSVFVTAYGSLVTLGHPDARLDSEPVINIFRPIYRSTTAHARCSWEPV